MRFLLLFDWWPIGRLMVIIRFLNGHQACARAIGRVDDLSLEVFFNAYSYLLRLSLMLCNEINCWTASWLKKKSREPERLQNWFGAAIAERRFFSHFRAMPSGQRTQRTHCQLIGCIVHNFRFSLRSNRKKKKEAVFVRRVNWIWSAAAHICCAHNCPPDLIKHWIRFPLLASDNLKYCIF